MELKQYHRQGCVAVWSNSKSHGQLLACASPNSSNSSLSDLQILSVDLADPSKNLNVEGRSLCNNSYRCLAWGTYGEKQGTFPYGVIFGGMENGSFTLWNPADMIGHHDNVQQQNIDDQKSFIYTQQAQEDSYPIICAEWNPLRPNYLAYGSTSLLIMDISKDISSPDLMKPSSNNPHEGSYITSVTWNKQVFHILASAGSDGLIALYDIKTNKSIFTFRDNSASNNTRQVEIAWSKHISTQIAVTLDDQKRNQLQIWDLRNQKGPIVVIDKVHKKGINSMDWSQLDHDLILTASRDKKLVCWNYKQDEQPLSTRLMQSQVVKVAWSKALPSIYSVITNDGLSICSLDDKNIHSYIPKWLKVSANTAFNGNDSLLVYSQQRGNTMHQYTVKVQVKKQLQKQIKVLEQLLEHQNIQDLKDIQGETGQFWKLISTKKNQQGDSDIYDFLGLNKDNIIRQVQKYTGKKRDSFTANSLKSSKNKQKSKTSKADYIPVSGSQAASFFGSLSAEPLDKSFTKNQQQGETENVKYDMVPRNFNWDIGKQKLIKQNMLIGNYEGAIDAALKCGRTAQALIIAYSIDQTTFNSTLKTFFTQTTDNFISGILRHIAFKDSQQLVKKYDLDKWKQCIALIFSLSSSQKRKNLLALLAKRLYNQQSNSQQHQHASIYCYILAQQFQQVVQVYCKTLSKLRPNSKARKYQAVILGTRLLAIYSCMTVNIKQSPSFQRLVRELALICLQANKKLLSYKILTKYVGQSSNNYIQYLIQNTPQLSQYRNRNLNIVNLPIMNKRQQKTKKAPTNTNTKSNTNTNQQPYQQQVPTNIKPPGKQPKLPNRITAFNQPEEETPKAHQFVSKNKGGNPPPPPPPPPIHSQSKQNVPPVFSNQQKKPQPPPLPPKKGPYQQQQVQDYQQQDTNRLQPVQQPPIHMNRGNIPPPPPPKHNQPTHKIVTNNQQPQKLPQQKKGPVPPKKNIGGPPPPPLPIHKTQPESTGRQSNLIGSGKIPPPPNKRQVQQQHNTSYQQPQVRKNNPPPPPSKNNIPPPPPSSNIKNMSIPTPKGNQNVPMPPPPAQKQQQYYQQRQQQDQQDEQYEYEQTQATQQQAQHSYNQPQRVIQPPQVKKNGPPPPPPGKSIVRTQSQHSQHSNQQQQQLTQSQQMRRGPPPPPSAKRNPPPPPPGRR